MAGYICQFIIWYCELMSYWWHQRWRSTSSNFIYIISESYMHFIPPSGVVLDWSSRHQSAVQHCAQTALHCSPNASTSTITNDTWKHYWMPFFSVLCTF